ncbi:Alpha-12-mannosyltransferase MNN22 [Spathaspora sp. JA1]|nr:Alpha-12-mannosyltransferase MNN22 [Spathaspora sp. JA1]
MNFRVFCKDIMFSILSQKRKVLPLVFAILIFVVIFEATSILDYPSISRVTSSTLFSSPEPESPQSFWSSIFKIYDSNKIPYNENDWIEYPPHMNRDFAKTRKRLLERCKVSQPHLEEIKRKHSIVVTSLPDSLPKNTYVPGSKGIVMMGGGFFSWLSFLSVLQLREVGSTLPIEIVIPSMEEYDSAYCDEQLPKYNARCVVITEELGLNETEWKFEKYQYKGLALLVNSFQHVFLLDSDNFPVSNVDQYFESSVYKDNGMVLWPDYWKRSISPLYYDIANLSVTYDKQVRSGPFDLLEPYKLNAAQMDDVTFHDLEGAIPDLSTESGQLMVDKASHGKMLLLSLYYNVVGPHVYYRLFSLGARGEGDKDTFASAALVTKTPYYQVKTYIRPFFMTFSDKSTKSSAMGQHDPQLDYDLYLSKYSELKAKYTDITSLDQQKKLLEKFNKQYFHKVEKDVPIFSVHCNIWKLDPPEYMNRKEIYSSKENRMTTRMFNNFKYIQGEGEQVDFELQRWKLAHKIACEDKVMFTNFQDKDMDKVCEFISNSVEWLSNNSGPETF